MNIGLSVYGEFAKSAANFKELAANSELPAKKGAANEVPCIRKTALGGITLTYLPQNRDKLSGKNNEGLMADNREVREDLLRGIREDLKSSHLDEGNPMVRAFLADAAKQLNCGQDVKLEDAGQDLESATVKDLLDRLEEVKATANAGCDVDLEMLTDEQKTSLANVLGLSDESKLKGIKFAKTPERAYGSDVFEAEIPSEGEGKPESVRVLMDKDGRFKLESDAAATGVSAGEVDLEMLDDRQLTSLVKALGLSDRNALNEIGFAKTGEMENECAVFEAAIFKPGATKPMHMRVLMDKDGTFKLAGDVEKKKPVQFKMPTLPQKRRTRPANPNVVTEIEMPPESEMNELQKARMKLKSPWAPGQEPDWWKEVKG